MITRAASLRNRLLIAMLVTAAVGLGAAALGFNHVESAAEHSGDAASAPQKANAIAGEIRAGAGIRQMRAFQTLMPNDQLIVQRGGRVIFQGPNRTGRRFERRAETPIPGGMVTVTDYSSPVSNTTLELTLITAGVLALVIIAAILAATWVTRAVRFPVDRAIDAAERVSEGDFSARMGVSGPEELVKLGSAFDDMAARLEQADRDQRQFLADVAHEIATPVNAVTGFALALADGAAQDEDERREAKSVIEAQAARLRDLLSDLRRLTQLDLAEGVRVSPVSLRPFGERLAASFRQAARDAGVELSFVADDHEVMTDARLLEMIASNLLSNAVRYTPAGGSVHLELARRGNKVLLRVIDTGVGIPPEHQKRIFDRLYRVDSTRARATGGSGLGLAIVLRAVQTLGGHIGLSSAPGEGSEFHVILPVASTPEPVAAETHEEPSALKL